LSSPPRGAGHRDAAGDEDRRHIATPRIADGIEHDREHAVVTADRAVVV
jgi:hypothetical protein